MGSSGPITAGVTYEFNVTSLVTGNGPVSFGLTTTHTTALSLASRQSANPPQLIVGNGRCSDSDADPNTNTLADSDPFAYTDPTPTPPPDPDRLTVITRLGDTYSADAQWIGGTDYSGASLKLIGESAINQMDNAGGGTIQFEAGIFDFGADYFYLRDIANIVFAGRGMDVTVIQNNTSAATDTEPFNTGGANYVTIRDMTVSAGGAKDNQRCP